MSYNDKCWIYTDTINNDNSMNIRNNLRATISKNISPILEEKIKEYTETSNEYMALTEMIHKLNLCSSIESVEIKPYSINQANNQPVTHKDFELFVQKWIESDVKKKFDFINEGKIINSLKKEYNAFSNNHVYITPNGNFGVLEFDKNDKEYFLELKSFKDYLKWADNEPLKNISDICKSCKYYLRSIILRY